MEKIIDLLWSFAKNIQTQLAMPEEYTFYINLIMHIGHVGAYFTE